MITNLTFSQAKLTFQIQSNEEWFHSTLDFDFSPYINQTDISKKIEINIHKIDSINDIDLPQVDEHSKQKDYIKFVDKDVYYFIYQSNVVCSYNHNSQKAVFLYIDKEACYEKLFLFIHSRLGEALDLQGIHRVHGLGVHYNNRAAIFLGISGTGKSTLAFDLLKSKEKITFFGEDICLVDNECKIHPFKMRWATYNALPDFPQQDKRVFLRQAAKEKNVVSPASSMLKWQNDSRPINIIVELKRTLKDKPWVKKLNKFEIFFLLLRDCGFGIGLPQVIEFFMLGTFSDYLLKPKIFFKRAVKCFQLTKQVQGRQLFLCGDGEKNVDKVLEIFSML